MLQKDVFVAALPRGHSLGEKESLQLHQLRNAPFIMYSPSSAAGLHSAVMLACQEAGFVPLVSQQAVQIQTVLSLVESGLGIALVPSIMQRYVSDKILYRPLQKIHMGAVGFALAWMEETESPAGAKFREMAVSIC